MWPRKKKFTREYDTADILLSIVQGLDRSPYVPEAITAAAHAIAFGEKHNRPDLVLAAKKLQRNTINELAKRSLVASS